MAAAKKVYIAEVGPRDGWQNHPVQIPTATKIKYIKKMADCGAKKMELTSFVSPKYVPQMADAALVYTGVKDYLAEKEVLPVALTLNAKGVENARKAGFDHVVFVLSASEEHNLRNSRRTIEQSLEIFKEQAKHAAGMKITLAMPCAFGSPFGDDVPADRIKRLIDEAEKVGVSEFGLADTAGISTPEHTDYLLREVKRYTDTDKLIVHLHDTYGMGLVNSYVALMEGVTKMETSLAGMGGCPFVPGAKGNIATEDLVYMLESMGIETGYDLDLLNETAAEMSAEIQAVPASCQSRLCAHA